MLKRMLAVMLALALLACGCMSAEKVKADGPPKQQPDEETLDPIQIVMAIVSLVAILLNVITMAMRNLWN